MTRQGPILPETDAIEDMFLSGPPLRRLGPNSAAEYWQARENGIAEGHAILDSAGPEHRRRTPIQIAC